MEQVNSTAAYLKIIERYEKYPIKYYRGQLERYKTIPPSIARNQGYFLNESNIYYETLKMCENEFNDLHTPLERLAKLQHYGVPTRLIDLTIDPLIALYFAVENINDKSHGNVYLYLDEGVSFNSKEAKVLSILPTLSTLNVNAIKAEYEHLFGENISNEEIIDIVSIPRIVQYTDDLKISNPRLYNQKGTFLICGNEVVDDNITTSLKSLDTISPTIIIRIPYEYKKAIKEELDLKYDINQFKIYPELPSVASYIKEKYKEENISFDGKYSIVKTDDISYGIVKRISIIVVLNEQMYIDQIKSLVINLFEQYKKKYKVVWIYVACNGDDYILSNWILRGQWIDPNLDENFRPINLKYYEDGYYWDYSQSFSTMNDFYYNYIFEDDKKLFILHQKIWEEFLKIYKSIYNSFQNEEWDKFISEFGKQQSKITDLYMQLQDLGHSHNKDFDDFLKLFSHCIIPIDNLRYEINNSKISENSKRYKFTKSFQKTETMIHNINQELSMWRDSLQIID